MLKKIFLVMTLMIESGSLNANMQPGHKNWEKTVKDGARVGAVVGGVAAGVTLGVEGIGVVAAGTSISIAPIVAGAVTAAYVGAELVHHKRCQKRCGTGGSDKFASMMGEVFSVIHQEKDNSSLKEWFKEDLFHNKENDAAACILKCSHYFDNMDFIRTSITEAVLYKNHPQEGSHKKRTNSVDSRSSIASNKNDFKEFLKSLRQSESKPSKIEEKDLNTLNQESCLKSQCSQQNCQKESICPKIEFIADVIDNIKLNPSLKPVLKDGDTNYEHDSNLVGVSGDSYRGGAQDTRERFSATSELESHSEFIQPNDPRYGRSDEASRASLRSSFSEHRSHSELIKRDSNSENLSGVSHKGGISQLIQEEDRNSDTLLAHIVIKEEQQNKKKSWFGKKIKEVTEVFQTAWKKIYPRLKKIACDNSDKIIKKLYEAALSDDKIRLKIDSFKDNMASWKQKLEFLDTLAKELGIEYHKYPEKIKERIKKMGCVEEEKPESSS